MRLALEQVFKNLALFFIDRNFRNFILLAFRIGGKKRYQELTIKVDGMKYSIPDNISFIWQFHEIFVQKSYSFNSDNDQPVILDCGANVGTSCLHFQRHYPQSKLVAFEPDPIIFGYLKKNIEINNSLNGIELINAAVWTDNTSLNFNSEGADGGAINGGQGAQKSIKVQAIDLKEKLKQYPEIELLKIDIEGAEYEVLDHCKDELSRVKNLFVECHSFTQESQKIQGILEILAMNNFRYFILNESNRKQPFINTKSEDTMDMQLNIFGYRSTHV